MPAEQAVLDEIALSREEYDLVVERLGREPNPVELGMFGALWSEHCGYKHSKPLLKLFPTQSPRVLVGAGEENAGVVDIGDGLALVAKIESHNHPSAIEPFQGAATGVGGIVRDIFTMGARPVALLNSLRFGPLADPRNLHLFYGVVGGISSYGNCIGVPDVGGEILFSSSYTSNPLVNAMCVGLLEKGHIKRAVASGEGNFLILVGTDTGRDGIHGASGLASRTFTGKKEQRSAVQVGNPFMEKILIEACLEAAKTDCLVGMQDLGAAGLTSAVVECAARGSGGAEIDVSLVPRREEGMTPYEVMLSESQERMLLVVVKGREEQVRSIFRKWDLHCATIGRVTRGGLVTVKDGSQPVACLPVHLLTDPPLYRLRAEKPRWLQNLQEALSEELPLPLESPGQVLLRLLGSPNISSKEWVYRQYDHQVQTNTVVPPGGDAAVLRVKGARVGIALTTDGNGRYCYLDPYMGGAMAVAEAARNLVCAGAEPIAITDCLNFGNPERPDVYFQMEECIRGMASACQALGIPVISGNVSLYNETNGEAIYPTPVVGGIGLISDIEKRCTPGFKREGDLVVLLGAQDMRASTLALGGSEFLEVVHGQILGRQTIDLELEARVQRCCLRLVGEGLLSSAHDCSEGGLAVALAESCFQGGVGFVGNLPAAVRWDAMLFGETPSRIVVSTSQEALPRLQALAEEEGVPWVLLGKVWGKAFSIGNLVDLPIEALSKAWRGGLETYLT